MRKNISKIMPLSLSIILVLLLTFTIVFSFTTETASADTTAKAEEDVKELTIGHITDIHYFPLSYCYQDVNNSNYKDSEFYASMTGDTKLVLESGLILAKTLKNIIADAEEGKAPLYYIASGDLSKNGEHVALIDVANSLRYVQNAVRALGVVNGIDYSNFQIFVTVGNHDLYNADAAIYSDTDGSSIVTDGVTASTFALIFAGLGFPNASLDGKYGIKLTDVFEESYWSSSYTSGYQQSNLSKNIEFSYYNDYIEDIYEESNKESSNQDTLKELYSRIDDTPNVLSYIASLKATGYESYTLPIIDATAREEGNTAYYRLQKSSFINMDDSYIESHSFYTEKNGVILGTEITSTKKLSKKTQINNLLSSNTPVYVNSDYVALVGGLISENCLDWLENYTINNINAVGSECGLNEESYVLTVHMNLLPHWEEEDDILKDFVLYNYEYTAKRLLNMGIHYVLSGHQHSSDVMSYTDAKGETIYDFETNSLVSYDSSMRYLTLTRYNCDGKLGEAFTSSMQELDDLKEVPSDHIFYAANWSEEAYQTALNKYKNNEEDGTWENVLNANPDYFTYTLKHDELSTLTYNEYSNKDIYSILIDRLLDHFVSDDFIGPTLDGIYTTIATNEGMIKTVASVLGIDTETLSYFAEFLVDEILNNLYEDDKYPDYNDSTKYYTNAYDYIKAIAQPIVDMEYGDDSIQSTVNAANKGKMKISEIAVFILLAHTQGIEVSLDDVDFSIYTEKDYTGTSLESFGFKNPSDKVYRQRMVAALKDLKAQCESGKFVNDLLNKLLEPLYYADNSLLKTLLTKKFNLYESIDDIKITQDDCDNLQEHLSILIELVNTSPDLISGVLEGLGITITGSLNIPNIQIDNIVLLDIINPLIDVIKPIVADLIGFNMEGPDIYTIINNALESYITDSFNVGLGGIAYDIVISYATDVYPDYVDNTDISKETLVQPYKNYSYAGIQLSYLSTLNTYSKVGDTFNAATQDNGRVPSRITSNFDTIDSTNTYTIKFYTSEDVYGTFKFKTIDETDWHSVSTTEKLATEEYEENISDYKDVTVEETYGNIKVTVFTQTKPQYIPLIDLGLLCLTHAEIQDEDDNFYTYSDREAVLDNSVIYWNVTTVTITGLNPNTTYCYDICGNYEIADDNYIYFSAVQFAQTKNYTKDYYTFTTAADDSVTDFEFLTIADIQGMIESMYTSSYNAVEALLNDNRTNTYDFILNAGDMADSGKNFYQWGYALNTYEQFFANTSTFFTSGNHEGGTYAMTNYYNYSLPEGEDTNTEGGLYYSFNYGNSHFIVLNTNDADSNGLGETQYKWLVNDLQNNNKKWTFVLMHKSLYSGGSHSTDAEVVAMRKQLVPLFANNGVSMVFAGHDHTYTSTYLLDENGNIQDKGNLQGVEYTGDGVLYITLGTMGTKYYTYAENELTTSKFDEDKSIEHTLDSQTFGKVVVSNDKITFTSYYYNQETDSLEIIGETILSDSKVLSKAGAIAMIVVIPTVIIGGIAITLIVLKKKGKLKKRITTEPKNL